MPDLPHLPRLDDADYRYLDAASRAELAWEWLRRDSTYRAHPLSAQTSTSTGLTIFEPAPDACRARWGCVHIADVRCRSGEAPILWDSAIDGSVLRVEARPAAPGDPDRFDLDPWASCALIVAGGEGDEHLLLRHERSAMHLHVTAGTILDGPVTFRFDIPCTGHFDAALMTLRRFLRLRAKGLWSSEEAISDRLLAKTVRTLRVHDALMLGASIRDVGIMIFGEQRVKEEWAAPGDALKSHSRRLIVMARKMAAGGYRALLR